MLPEAATVADRSRRGHAPATTEHTLATTARISGHTLPEAIVREKAIAAVVTIAAALGVFVAVSGIGRFWLGAPATVAYVIGASAGAITACAVAMGVFGSDE
jgi:fatty acid desaturase